MIIPIFRTQKTTIPNLDELVTNYHKPGGAIVQYDRVFSIILYTQRSPKFEWVPVTGQPNSPLEHLLK
jgi:hypothetical protein